jgi:nicotinate-nucleotide pyrophosphorylase (carboxylating)
VPTDDPLTALARTALAEDAPTGDLTSRLVLPEDARCAAEIRAKAPGVLAGIAAAQAVFRVAAELDGPVELAWDAADGTELAPGDRVATARGSARAILRAERPALNLLAHLSGIATLTRAFVRAAAPARILCTRKTTPGLRALEREAVAAGGGELHRASLSDAILIKDNHVRLAGGVGEAVRRARRGALPVEVEVEDLGELEEALAAGADRVLLDNAGPEVVAAAVARIGDPERLEISGGVTLEGLPALVRAGARLISVGRITHSAPALDLSLEVTGAD